eukprot:SAG11_NODE_9930_length_869_cov_0.874026_1_plen_20_part_10
MQVTCVANDAGDGYDITLAI